MKKQFVLLLLILFPLLLSAEDFFTVKEEIIEKAWLKTSIFYITPSISISNLGYNTNIYGYDFIKSADWSSNFRLNMDVAVIAKERFILRVTESPSYSVYLDNSKEKSFNNELSLKFYTWVGRFNILYQYDNIYLHDLVNPETGWKVRRWENMHTLSIDYGDIEQFYLNLYLKRRSLEFTDELYLDTFNLNRFFNRTEYWVGLSANRPIFSRSLLTLLVECYEHRFRYVPQRNRTGTQVTLGLYFPAGSNVTGGMRFGFTYIRPTTTFYRDLIKPTGAGLIGIRFLKRFRINLQYSLDNQYSYTGVNFYYDQRNIGLGAGFYFTRDIRLNYLYRIGERSYKLLGGGEELRRDRFDISHLRLIFEMPGKADFGLEYRCFRSTSTSRRYYWNYDYFGGFINYAF